MYSVSVKCLIFTLIIIDFYVFFGQSTGGKELTIDKDNIFKGNKILYFFKFSIKISQYLRYACVTSLNSQKNTLFKNLTPHAI
jgi:hypothetical protein